MHKSPIYFVLTSYTSLLYTGEAAMWRTEQ